MTRKAMMWGFVGLFFGAVVGWNLLASAGESREEIYLGHGYTFGGVTLKAGKYLVVHKDDVMKEGEACTFIYRLPYRADKEPIAKAHCTKLEGAAAKEFTLKSTSQPDGTSVVKSIQFPGSKEVHAFETGSGS